MYEKRLKITKLELQMENEKNLKLQEEKLKF